MTSERDEPITVLGAGAWGTTLAILLARNHQPTLLWDRNPQRIAAMQQQRSNERDLPGITFPPALRLSADLHEAVGDARDLLIAVSSAGFCEVLDQLGPHYVPGTRVAWATKGLQPGTGKLLHTVVEEHFGHVETAVISGPTFAMEVAQGLPTAITVAATTADYAARLAARLQNPRFRAYTTTDMIGVQLGGAAKNALAIAAGIADGLGYGANTRAALVTRGLAEMSRLGIAMGGQQHTFSGLAGLGDLLLTCTDNQSRNRRFGLLLGQGSTVSQALESLGQLVEGLPTTREIMHLARATATEMPICEQVYNVLYEGRKPLDAVDALFNREQKPE